MKHSIILVGLFILLLTTISCEKVIDLNLKSVPPALVIEGNISDQPGPYTVKLSQTVNYNKDNTFPAVGGAQVILKDNVGNTETLTETSVGTYTSTTLQGVSGREYTLTVSTNGQSYTGVSSIPQPVNIDTIVITDKDNGGFFGGGGSNSDDKNRWIDITVTDPVGVENYYYFVVSINGVIEKDLSIASDNLNDGKVFTKTIEFEIPPNSGDIVTVALQSIDKNVYEYFRTLGEIGGGFQPSTPANPTTNLSNNALGYFKAFSVKQKTTTAP